MEEAKDYVIEGIKKYGLKDYNGAIEDYNKAIELKPSYADTYNKRGVAKAELKDYAGAIEDYNKAIKLDPNLKEAYINRGVAKEELKDYAGAIEDYNKAIKLDPKDAEAYYNRGVAKKQLRDFAGAIEDYNKAIKLNSNYAEAYNNRGVAKKQLKDYAGAIEDYNKAIKLDPKYAEAYSNRGVAKAELKDHQGAIEDYNKAIKFDPNLKGAYNNRGNAKEELKDYAGAIEDYNEAIKLDPNYAEAYNNRGVAKKQLKDYAGAIKDYNKAIKFDPNLKEPYYNRGIVTHLLERKSIKKASGTRDFDAKVLKKRGFITEHIKSVFEKYGFEPLETPAIERIETLQGQSGEESDRLMFKILNENYDAILSKIEKDAVQSKKETTNSEFSLKEVSQLEKIIKNPKQFSSFLCSQALRYDLTVPFARYAAENRGEITLPFKRFQIQPVWRGERSQKGRFREFYQCDADVIGCSSMLPEAEIIGMIAEVLSKLGITDYTIHYNHRKLLNSIAEQLQISTQSQLFQIIDKWDKIGAKGVEKLLQEKNYTKEQIEKLLFLLSHKEMDLSFLQEHISSNILFQEARQDIDSFLSYVNKLSIPTQNLSLSLNIVRGLAYYTGMVFEVVVKGIKMGSIAGGGRYGDLTSSFGWDGVSGVGISFGLDRIYEVMTELALFSSDLEIAKNILCINFGVETETEILTCIAELRKHEIGAQYYPQNDKIKKQLRYAEKKKILFTLFLGEEELKNKQVTIKNMLERKSYTVDRGHLISFFKKENRTPSPIVEMQQKPEK